MPKQHQIPPTLTHFTTPTSNNCTGFAHKFGLLHKCDTDPLQLTHSIIHHRLSPKEIINNDIVHFMDCSNHVNYSMKGQGTLCAVHIVENDLYLLGIVTSFDKSIKISLCRDSSCFFYQPSESVHSYFSITRDYPINMIYRHELKLYYLNQLNGIRPFQRFDSSDILPQPPHTPSWLISTHDNKYNSSPFGPDKIDYNFLIASALPKHVITTSKSSMFATSTSDYTTQPRKKKKRSSKSRGQSRKGHMAYRLPQDRLLHEYTSFNFGTSIDTPTDTYAVPYTSLESKLDNDGLSTRRFAFLTTSDLNKLINHCNSNPTTTEHFNELIQHFPTFQIPVIDPLSSKTKDVAIVKSISSTTQHYPVVTYEKGEFSSINDSNVVVLSYWKKDEMKVCSRIDMAEYIRAFRYTYSVFHASRDRTHGDGLNVYDGRVGGQGWGNTVHRCGRDCLQHEFYSKDWESSMMPFVSKMRNVMVHETTVVTKWIDYLALRLLDIGTSSFDLLNDLGHRGHATMSLSTMGTPKICAFCNWRHSDLNDRSEELTEATKKRLTYEPMLNDPGYKDRKREQPKGDHEVQRFNYSMRFINSVGIGMPTTCGYYLHKEDGVNDDDEFVQYFIESGLGCAVRLNSFYYSHFYGYAFDHQTSVPLVIRKGLVKFENTGMNMIAWGPARVITQRRVATGRRLGIIRQDQDGRSLTQQRITEFFGRPENIHHPERFLFRVNMNQLDVSVQNRLQVARQLGIVGENEQLNRAAIGDWFAQNGDHPQRFLFGCDVEDRDYHRIIGVVLGFLGDGEEYTRAAAAAWFQTRPDHPDRYIFNM